MDTTKRLFRSEKDSMIAGICGGLSEYFNVDSSLVRLIFILISFTGGSGLLIYIVLWVIIPRNSSFEQKPESKIKESAKEINADEIEVKSNANKRDGGKNIFGLILLTIGLIALWNQLMPVKITGEWVLPGLMIVSGVFLIFK